MKTKTISIFKADPTLQDETIPDLEISINTSCEYLGKNQSINVEELFDREAENLADALFGSLPQGIFDRLIMHLMQKKVSVYFGKTRF